MNAAKEIRERILAASPQGHGLAEGWQIWDVLVAARGLTVILDNGQVVCLPMPEMSARRLAHGFSAQARAEEG